MNAETSHEMVMNCANHEADVANFINVTMEVDFINVILEVEEFGVLYFGVG